MSDVETIEDARDFTSRQLAREFAGGATLADATARLRAALAPGYQWSVDEVESLVAGRPDRAFPQAGAVIAAARESGGSAERAFAAYENSLREFRPRLTEAFAGASTFGTYLASLIAVLIVVVAVYSIFVFPQFEAMYDAFDQPLPAFTSMILGSYWIVVPLLLLLLLALGGFFFGLRAMKRRLSQLQCVRPALGKVPGFGRWAARYDAALWMRYFGIFLDAGLAHDAARAAADRFAGRLDDGHRRQLLASAESLGVLRDEVAAQLRRDAETTLEQFESPRNLAVVLIRMLVYLLVATYVLAMYLPVFKLGAII